MMSPQRRDQRVASRPARLCTARSDHPEEEATASIEQLVAAMNIEFL